MHIVRAEHSDLPQILQLQHLAFQSEAALLGNDRIPPLLQTLPALEDEYKRGTILKAVNDEGNLIGSVRGHVEAGTLYIGKLVVQPALQGRGIGRQLLDEIERLHPRLRCEIFTSAQNIRTLQIYERRGYRRCKEEVLSGVNMVYMEKQRSFSAAIESKNTRGHAAVIPDIKCVSPKHGDLLQGRNPIEVAKLLVSHGAPVLSVVTEQKNFGGSVALLRDVAKTTGVPVLRKDFFTHEAQLEESSKVGASAVLLICATIERDLLARLYERALALGLEPLVEVCTADEMRFACSLGAKLIGINNRNIATLELDSGGPARTAKLAKLAPKDALLISESGIVSREDAQLAVKAGAHAVLVGTALWQAKSPAGDWNMAEIYKSLEVPICAQA